MHSTAAIWIDGDGSTHRCIALVRSSKVRTTSVSPRNFFQTRTFVVATPIISFSCFSYLYHRKKYFSLFHFSSLRKGQRRTAVIFCNFLSSPKEIFRLKMFSRCVRPATSALKSNAQNFSTSGQVSLVTSFWDCRNEKISWWCGGFDCIRGAL